MPDKQLTEAAWNTFSKGASYKDAALIKALGALDKAEKKGFQAELEALDELEKQADALRKANKADKKLGDYLDALEKSLAKQRKDSQAALEKEKKSASDEEEEESPALLTTKMIPLIRDVRKGNVVLQALVAVAGKETKVLLSRRAISPARGKLLKEEMANPSGIKFIRGECLFEENALTFVVQSQAAGLAKRLRAALMEQTDLRLKVRVRGESPDDVDADGEDDAPGTPTGTSSTPPSGTAQPEAPAPGTPAQAPDPQKLRFEQRLAELEPRVAEALRRQAGDTGKIRMLADFAREKGASGGHAAALQALDTLEKLLAAAATAGTAPTGGTQPEPPAPTQARPQGEDGVDPGTAFNSRLSALLPRLKEAMATLPDLKLKVSEAGLLARKREFDAAHAVLDEAEDLISRQVAAGPQSAPPESTEEPVPGAPADTPPGKPSLVQQRVFMLTRWKKIPEELRVELGGLQAAIQKDGADEDAAELVDSLSSYLQDLLSDLQDDMDDAINAGSTDAFKGLVQRVESDPVMGLLASNPTSSGKAFRSSVLGALREIEKSLAG